MARRVTLALDFPAGTCIANMNVIVISTCWDSGMWLLLAGWGNFQHQTKSHHTHPHTWTIHYILGIDLRADLALCIGIKISSKVHRQPYSFQRGKHWDIPGGITLRGTLGEMGGPGLQHTLGARLARRPHPPQFSPLRVRTTNGGEGKLFRSPWPLNELGGGTGPHLERRLTARSAGEQQLTRAPLAVAGDDCRYWQVTGRRVATRDASAGAKVIRNGWSQRFWRVLASATSGPRYCLGIICHLPTMRHTEKLSWVGDIFIRR
jgi:hypothetical protein